MTRDERKKLAALKAERRSRSMNPRAKGGQEIADIKAGRILEDAFERLIECGADMEHALWCFSALVNRRKGCPLPATQEEKQMARDEGKDGMKGLIPYGEVYLCIVRGGILEIDGTGFEIDCADGQYHVSAYGRNQFLLIEAACPGGLLTGEARPGTWPRLSPARIRGCILRPARILSRNHSVKTAQDTSSFPRACRRVERESPPRRNSGRDCSIRPCGNAAMTCRCAENGHGNAPRSNSRHNHHRKTETHACSYSKDSTNFLGSTEGREKTKPQEEK
jgi:hypothetical protein